MNGTSQLMQSTTFRYRQMQEPLKSFTGKMTLPTKQFLRSNNRIQILEQAKNLS